MDDSQRDRIQQALVLLRQLQPTLEQAKALLAPVASEERKYLETRRDEQAENAAGWLDDAFVALDDFDLDDIVLKLEDACD